MFTSPTATREQALKATAAAERAMERQACCKSQFKFKCFSCGEFINRGDKITKCTAPCWDGMRLRFRGADARNGLTMEETAFYLAETGTRTWVHIGCNPCYWDSLPEDNPEYSPPALRSAYTGWGAKVSYEFDEWRQRTNHYDMEEFLEKHGYPQDKWMKDRIVHAVTRFQALWRGYIYKKAYPIARLDAIATRILNEAGLATFCGQEVPDLITKRQREAERNARARNGFLHNNCFGAHMEILFDEKQTRAAIYSGEVIKIQGQGGDGLYYWVKFHHDGEVRKYHWKRLLNLKLECDTFKSKHGILAEIKGKISVYCFIHGASYTTVVYKKKIQKKK